MKIYKIYYGDKWAEKIPWGSRHLPTFKLSGILRANDFKVIKGYDNNRSPIFMPGSAIKDNILKIRPKGLFIGLGIGQNFFHLDVDRQRDAEWGYRY